MRRRHARAATLVGLAIALGGAPAIALVSARNESPASAGITEAWVGQLALWTALVAVLVVVRFGEGESWESIGLRRPRASTLGLGLLVAGGFLFVFSPAAGWLAHRAGLSHFGDDLGPLLTLPVWYLALAAITAGVVEETFYRGYAIERLVRLTGSYVAAVLLASAAFGLAHIPSWSVGPALIAFAAGLVQSGVYLWRRDLGINIVAHAVADLVGLLAAD